MSVLFPKRKQSGFTLIELLVVISIIAVLASVILASLNITRAKARDAKRRSDINQIQVALELYRNDHESYFVAGGGFNGNGTGWVGFENGSTYPTAVTRVLFNEGHLPVPLIDDPLQSPGYMIYLCNGAQTYSISATLEYPTPADIAAAETGCNGTGQNGVTNIYGKNVMKKN
jgi:prepilin-type N-terminal cleavage/methylation domain-containing protein